MDRTWASAYTIGNNGLGPWGKRPNIADDAVWIWNSKVRMGTHIISRVSKVIINSKWKRAIYREGVCMAGLVGIYLIAGLEIRSFDFWANNSFFVQKWANERFAHNSHFLWATWANCSWSLIFGERNERFTHIAHLIWAKWGIHSHSSPKKRKWANMSDSLIFFIFYFLKPLIKL